MIMMCVCVFFFFFKQKTAYEMRISDWSSDVCSSDLKANPQRYTEQDHRDQEGNAPAPVGEGLLADQRARRDDDEQRRKQAERRGGQIGSASCRERVCQYV